MVTTWSLATATCRTAAGETSYQEGRRSPRTRSAFRVSASSLKIVLTLRLKSKNFRMKKRKRKLDDIIIEMKGMIEDGQDDEAFRKFPRNYLTYGEKLKSIIHQKRDFFRLTATPALALGGPGEGKSALLQGRLSKLLQQNWTPSSSIVLMRKCTRMCCFKILITPRSRVLRRSAPSSSRASVMRRGILSTKSTRVPRSLASRSSFRPTSVSDQVLPEDTKGRHEQLTALTRRYWQVNIRALLPHPWVEATP